MEKEINELNILKKKRKKERKKNYLLKVRRLLKARKHLRFPWTTRASNQSILKELNPEHSLEGLVLKLKL